MIEYIVLTHPKNHHICKDIERTWGKNSKLLFLSDENTEGNIKNFGGNSGYQNIYQKYIGLFKNYTPNSEWIFFCDDDTYTIKENLEALLDKCSYNENAGIGRILELKANCLDRQGRHTGFPLNSLSGFDTRLPLLYLSGGAGFALSLVAYKNIQRIINNDPESAYNSDVALGFWLRRVDAKLIHNAGFFCEDPKTLNHSDDIIKNSITYHYVKNHNELFQRLN